MTLKGDATFERKLTCDWKNDTRNLINFHASRQKSENLHFDWILLSKACKDLDEKIQKSYVSWHWRVMQSLKKKLALGSKKDTRNLVNFHPTTQMSRNFSSMGHFCPKYLRFELKQYRGVVFHDTEQWCTICINLDHVVSKMTWRIGWTFIRALKVLKVVHWWALFVKTI